MLIDTNVFTTPALCPEYAVKVSFSSLMLWSPLLVLLCFQVQLLEEHSVNCSVWIKGVKLNSSAIGCLNETQNVVLETLQAPGAISEL